MIAAGVNRTPRQVRSRAQYLGIKRVTNPLSDDERSTTRLEPQRLPPPARRAARVTRALFDLAETPGLTLEQYERRKREIIGGQKQ